MKTEQQIINQFHQAITEAVTAVNCKPPEGIIADDQIQRFRAKDKAGDDSGRYKLDIKPDDKGRGFFGYGWFQVLGRLDRQSWNSGAAEAETTLTPEQIAEQNRKYEADREQKRQAEAEAQAQAAEKAKEIYLIGVDPDPEHGYLKNKKVKAYGIRQNSNDDLIIPAFSDLGQISTLQFIKQDGTKKFLPGGSTKAVFFTIGEKPEPGEPLYIAEGYATAATIHQATGQFTAVAFSAGQLKAVAEKMRGLYPGAELIICGDNDESGTGQRAAKEAAEHSGGRIILPAFSEGGYGDFNDLFIKEGLPMAREQITAKEQPETATAPSGGGNGTEAKRTPEQIAKETKAGFLELREKDRVRTKDSVIGLRIPRFEYEMESDFYRGLFETVFDGLQAGFYIVAAETNIGKTAFLTNLCLNVLLCKENSNSRLLYLSMDDEKNIILYRFLAILSQITLPDLRRELEDKKTPLISNLDLKESAEVPEEMFPRQYHADSKTIRETRAESAEKEICRLLDNGRLNVYDISDSEANSMTRAKELINQAIAEAEKAGQKLFVAVDGLYNLDMDNTGNGMREASIQRANELKAIVDTHKIPLLTTGELRKKDESKPPALSDLMETGKFAYNASAVILLRPANNNYKAFREKDIVYLIADIQKNKLSDFKGTIGLIYDRAGGRFLGEWKNPKEKTQEKNGAKKNGGQVKPVTRAEQKRIEAEKTFSKTEGKGQKPKNIMLRD